LCMRLRDYLLVIDTETEFNLFLSLPLDRLYKDFSSVRTTGSRMRTRALPQLGRLYNFKQDWRLTLKKHLTNIDVTQAVDVVQ